MPHNNILTSSISRCFSLTKLVISFLPHLLVITDPLLTHHLSPSSSYFTVHTHVKLTMSLHLHPLHWQPLSRRQPISRHRRSASTRHNIAASLSTARPAPIRPALEVVVKPVPHESGHKNIDHHRPQLADPTSLKSTWAHRAWVITGCTTVLLGLAKSVTTASDAHRFAGPLTAALAGYIVADLFTGVYHWAIDNYGDSHTPIVGAQIEGFQGHHRWPWTITRREFSNNLHALARNVTVTVLPAELAVSDPTVLAFVAACSGCIMFSQQFHAWAHGTKSRLPPIVVGLQDMGLLISRAQHAAHHLPPYSGNYCIVSGLWNELLDHYKVFEALEMIIFFKSRIRPRSWCEPNSDWEQEDEE